jgi:hypothetical protein
MVAPGCTDVTQGGQIAWRAPRTDGCTSAITDFYGNTYLSGSGAHGTFVESLGPSGRLRWQTFPRTTYTGYFPALGANGSVFFSFYGGTIMGFDEQTGATTWNSDQGSIGNLLSAYGAGLAVATGVRVDYLSYAGAVLHTYSVDVFASPNGASSLAFGTGGAVFFAGYSGCTRSGGVNLSVIKITPAGRAWTWTHRNVYNSCEMDDRASISATPDGGAVVASYVGEDAGSQPVTFSSVGPTGTLRWTVSPKGPLGPASYAEAPIVDTNGTVGLPSDRTITCAGGTMDTCGAFHIDFVSESSTAPTLSPFTWADTKDNNDFADFGDDDIAIYPGRIFIVRKINYITTLSAFSETGLATSFTLNLQEAVTTTVSTPAQLGAVKWAKKMINSPLGAAGGTYWNGCLAFVLDAYQKGADVNLRQSLAVEIGPNTYPVDIWPVGASAGHFTPGSGTTGTGNDPPAGALVFWDSTGGGDPVKARDDSHVAISVGDGTLISTNVVGYNGIHEETMAQFAHNSWNLYQGWWLPGTN